MHFTELTINSNALASAIVSIPICWWLFKHAKLFNK